MEGVRRKMERRPPPMSPDASRPSQFATQSVTCAILRGELYVMPLLLLRCSSRGWF